MPRANTARTVPVAVASARDGGGLDVCLETGTEPWKREALCQLVGNARRFAEEGGRADVTDGMFDAAVVGRMLACDLVSEAVRHRVLGQGTNDVTHVRAAQIIVTGRDGQITFSRGGETSTRE